MAKIVLGFNANCFTNRYDEPGEWTRICADLGVRHVMFSIDLIDPLWPWGLQRRLCDQTLDACARRGIAIRASFGGHHGHRHYLGHPDRAVRHRAEDFYRRAIRQTAYLGGASFGTCFAILSVRDHEDPQRREAVLAQALDAYARLSAYAADQGLGALVYEATSTPRESCATFAENDRVLAAGAHWPAPLRVCLDLGHRYLGGAPQEADPLAWIRRYGARCDVIDCQQTDRHASRHWPFTDEHNARGTVRADEVVAAVEDSGEGEVLLAFEIRTPAFHPQENAHLDHLAASVAYWRRWVRD